MDEISVMGDVFLARRRKAAERLRSFEITLPQLHLIQLARRRGAVSPSAAAAELFSDRPTATLIVQKCVRYGWLIRKRSETDRRSFRLELSGEGEELLDRIERAKLVSIASLGDPLDTLGPEEREAFRVSLLKVEARARELYGS
jgi:MarR family transcriptional regulator, 2-MHQ and catechol-resistance regulon repressor